MKFFFGFFGAVLGALMGDIIGGLVGLAVGVGFAALLDGFNRKDDPAPTRSLPTLNTPIEAKVKQLEREVASLRAEVLRLGKCVSGMVGATAHVAAAPDAVAEPVNPPATPTPTATAVVPPAPSEPARPVIMPAPVTEAVPAVLSVPVEEEAPLIASNLSEWLSQPVTVNVVPAVQPSPVSRTVATSPPPPPPPPPKAQPAPATPPRSLQESMPPFLRNLIFGGNTIVKVGVLILFLGLAFLLRYAAERVTVPVELRYAGVALAGAVLLGLGWRLRHRKDASGGTGYGLILQGAGIGVFYLTILAALKLNALLPPEVAFAFLFVVAVLSAVLAVVQNASWLAFVAAAEGFAAPVLVSTGGGNHIALFSYLAILDIGIFLVAWHKAWRPLNLIGCIGTFMLAAGWAQKHYVDALYPSTQAFLLLFFCLFTAIGVLFARRALALGSDPDERDPLAKRAAAALSRVGRVDSTLVFGVPLASFGLQYLMVRGYEYGPALAAFGFSVFYLLLGGQLIRGRNPRFSLLGEAYVVISVLFGTLTIPLALEGTWTGATWAIEAAGMYWLGMRQRRVYARAFAVLVLGAAVWQVLGALDIDVQPGTPLLTGSVLGMLLLCGSALAMFIVGRRVATEAGDAAQAGAGSSAGSPSSWEEAACVGFLWTGLAALASIPWLLLTPQWACTVTSLMALGCALWHSRVRLPSLQAASSALHLVALGGFVGTLHTVDGLPMLSNGWQGLVAAIVIGLNLLATGWLPLRAALIAAQARGTTPDWSLGSSIGLLAGLAMLSGSLLFVMPADQAARIWPWMGVAALWLGLRLSHPALKLAWLALQLAGGAAFLLFGPSLWSLETDQLTLWTPLGLTLAALLCGDWLQRAASKGEPGWANEPPVQWGVVLWAVGWWTAVLLPDALRHVQRQPGGLLWWPVVLTGWVLLSSVLAAGLARWRKWAKIGQLTGLTVPAWAAAAWLGVQVFGQAPHAQLGWLVWPLALVWHGALLRMQSRWWPATVLKALHVLGFWLFVVLAAREVQGWAPGWGDAGSAWVELGWVIVPALVLWLMTRRPVLQRWPLSEFRTSYLAVACAPVALYLWLWLWVSNTGAGVAAPLPYVPLLNPLEIGQGLVLLALFLWQSTEPMPEQYRLPPRVLLAGLGATLFVLYTGMVLRTCHHWAGVPWESDALFASTLTQSALSATWSLLGVALMLAGHRKMQRLVWAVGAALLGVVVLKLFFIELADRGGLYRIVSFIVVGVLLLMVGYFAPVPPSRDPEAPA